MKKIILSALGVAALGAAVVFNFKAGLSSNAKNDMALANIEALAQGETSEEFKKLGCECADSGTCRDNNGRLQSYAKRI
jgi:hypothetical protein